MTDRTDQIKALANETRMDILRVLDDPGRHFAHQESADPVEIGVCVQLLASYFGVSQPTMSRHVELLRRANFLSAKRQQKWTYCSRNEAALRDYSKWLVATLNLTAE